MGRPMLGWTLCACLLVAGCGPSYERLDIDLLTDPPRKVSVDDGIQVSLGVVAIVRVRPISSSSSYDSDEVVRLDSRNDSILTVEASTEHRTFALIGMSEGETCVEVSVDGDFGECIPARVVDDL